MNIKQKTSGQPALSLRQSWRGALAEPSTWAGVATIIGTTATGGLAGLVDPAAIAQIVAGVSLIAMREAKEN